MVWLSTTTCTPRRPRKRLRHPLLRNMRLSLPWLPSMAKHENFKRVLHWRAKKYMWSIHKCDHSSLGHCKSKWALPIAILHSGNLPRSAPDSQDVRHAYTHILAKLSHQCLQTFPHGLPPTRLLFIPPSSRHTAMSASHLRVRMNCTAAAHSNLTLPFALALSLPFAILPFVTVLAAMRATSRISWKKLRTTTAADLPVILASDLPPTPHASCPKYRK